jgi:hypothetical protein
LCQALVRSTCHRRLAWIGAFSPLCAISQCRPRSASRVRVSLEITPRGHDLALPVSSSRGAGRRCAHAVPDPCPDGRGPHGVSRVFTGPTTTEGGRRSNSGLVRSFARRDSTGRTRSRCRPTARLSRCRRDGNGDGNTGRRPRARLNPHVRLSSAIDAMAAAAPQLENKSALAGQADLRDGRERGIPSTSPKGYHTPSRGRAA